MKKLGVILTTVAISCLPVVPAYAWTSSDIPNPPQDIVPLPPSQLSSDLGTTGIRVTAPFHSEPGAIRSEFGAPGPHPVEASIQTSGCGPFYDFYNHALRLTHGVNTPAGCYHTMPEGNLPAYGYQYIYPSDLKAGEKAPLMLLSPGIGVEPGLMHRHAEFYASHGFVVAMGYSFANWFGEQLYLAAGAAASANDDASHPLHDHIDFSNTVVAGHSAGGGSAVRVTNDIAATFAEYGHPEVQIKGIIGINPGPSDFGLASTPGSVPTLMLIAEHETLVAHPLSRLAFDKITGPKWWAVVKGALHGSYLDTPDATVYDSTVIAFSKYVTGKDANAAKVFTGPDYTLATDSELIRVERYGIS